MPRGKSNRGGDRANNGRDISRGGRQNASSQRSSSMDENNQRGNNSKGSRSQIGLKGSSRSEESDRSE